MVLAASSLRCSMPKGQIFLSCKLYGCNISIKRPTNDSLAGASPKLRQNQFGRAVLADSKKDDRKADVKMINTDFLLTSFVVVLIPGTGVIYTVSTGLFNGWRASIAAAFGCTTGIIPHLVASILGLSAILHMSAIAFQAVKYAGVLYLLYLAWSMWHENRLIKNQRHGFNKRPISNKY